MRGDKEIGQGVLLNWRDSGEVLRVSDGEGCQIWLDGVLIEKEGEWGRVRVLLESRKQGMPVMSVCVRSRAEDLERCDGVHVWSKFGARRIDKKRSGVDPDASPYWGEM